MIEVDASSIPVDKWDRPDFLTLKAEIEQALKNRKWRHAFSIHEAGHWIYYQRAGYTKYSFIGPQILYDLAQDKFTWYPAAVRCVEGSPPQKESDVPEWLITVAKACAAGGPFTRQLTAAPDSGDEVDRRNFIKIFTPLPQHDKFNLDELWKDAKEEVRKDLRSPTFRRFAWEKATQLRLKFFETD